MQRSRIIQSDELNCAECKRYSHRKCVPEHHATNIPTDDDDLYICHTCYKLDSDEDANSDVDEEEVFRFTGYGKEFIKSCKVSPDVYIQLALQLAYYRLYGKLTATYESASTRRFRLGRVDCIRSATPEALAWVQAMSQPKEDDDMGNKKVTFHLVSDEKKLLLWNEAVIAQTQEMVDNILGLGIDIHLLGLREAARETSPTAASPLPDIFLDPSYRLANKFLLSTSQVRAISAPKPQLRVTGVNRGYSSEEFVEELLNQNPALRTELSEEINSLKIVGKRPCRNVRRETWFLEADPSAFKKLIWPSGQTLQEATGDIPRLWGRGAHGRILFQSIELCELHKNIVGKKESSRYFDNHLLSSVYEHKNDNSVYLFKFVFDGNNVPGNQYSVSTKHQYDAISRIKADLDSGEALVHIDFSENYGCKYAEEIQSAHFGGSKPQLSLHTVVVYYKDPQSILRKKCYCTVSSNLRHDPVAICAHLNPVFDQIVGDLGQMTKIHFLSDGPANQYRNRKMFHLMANFISDKLQVEEIRWHFSEKGHGKVAPDGVGGVLKRTADYIVARGVDIPNLNAFLFYLQADARAVEVLVDVATTTDSFMGYGPVEQDGYGAAYNPKKDSIIFCLSAFWSSEVTSTSRFAQSLEESLNHMQSLLTRPPT
ncbi:unnamed protein product [Callosobruchus maculatus]|uniref:Choline O-acetyltransferase n=1 Tax=Callosobruchus maculatus TaxID=64391 RepID=A0A653DDF2_CALMS|nr:unnamed protein product [Callosobruchus maculatus]